MPGNVVNHEIECQARTPVAGDSLQPQGQTEHFCSLRQGAYHHIVGSYLLSLQTQQLLGHGPAESPEMQQLPPESP